ncbi:Melanopsin-A [Holothuria leucospilota]|uniref:Melanopsin-A n=1 Tax=Holothuria leucospilota TaxID=206669 RepID=A0A9Q0YQB2_HOLLE|nr:Melanopsin-A [Holothuria leucospilota]
MHLSWFQFVTVLVLIVAIVCGFLGNSLVLIAFILSKKIRTCKTNIFIVNLAVTDILTITPMFGVICLSVADEQIIRQSIHLLCGLPAALGRTFVGCSIITLVLIAVNRWILITKRFETYLKVYRLKNVFIMLLLTWLYSVILSLLPIFFDRGEFHFNAKFRICQVTVTNQLTFRISSNVILPYFTIAPILVVYCYGSIFRHVKAHRRRTRDQESTINSAISMPLHVLVLFPFRNQRGRGRHENQILKHRIDITKNLLLVVIVFTIFLLPYVVAGLLQCEDVIIQRTLQITLLNSFVNPIIYSVKHPSINTYLSVFC